MLIIAILIAALSLPLSYQLDPDFGWHVYLGRHMQSTGLLAHTLLGYNYFANLHLIDHQWLSHYFLNIIYSRLGYGSLIIMSAGIVWLTCLFTYTHCRKLALPKPYILLALFLYLASVRIVFGVRIQLLLLLGVAALVWVGKSSRGIGWRRLAYFLIFAVGNNMHGGFIMLVIIPTLLELDILRSKREKRGVLLKEYVLTMAIALVGLCLNPYGVSLAHLTWDYLSDPYYKSHINEWRPLLSLPLSGESVVFPLVTALFLLSLKRYWRRISLLEGLLLLFFGILGFIHIRFFPIFTLLAVPHIASAMQHEVPIVSSLSLRRAFFVTYGLIGVAVLAVLGTISYKDLILIQNKNKTPGYPYGAMQFLTASQSCKTGTFLNPYDWGGYIEGFYPNTKIFIDGRGPQLKISPGTTILQEADNFFQNDPVKIQEMLRRYDIGCVLVQKYYNAPENITTKVVRGLFILPQQKVSNPLQKYLENSAQWKLNYGDTLSAVFERTARDY